MNKFIYILAILFLAVALNAQEVEFTPDTTRFVIGEQVNFKLKAEADKALNVEWPVLNDTIGQLEVISRSVIDTTYKDNLQIIEQNYTLTNFDSGSYVLNPVRFKIGDSILYTKPKMIEVYSVEVDTTKQKLYPIKDNIEVGYSLEEILPYLLLLLLIIVVAFVAIYFYRKYINKERIEEEIKVPPFEMAMTGLKNLDKADLIAKGEIKEFYVRLSDILRRFIEDEHRLPAMESTTDEILDELKRLDFTKEIKANIKDLLVESDFVKFAKYQPETGKHDYYRKLTEELIVETRIITEDKGDE